MEYVEGQTLMKMMCSSERKEPLSNDLVGIVLAQIAIALHEVHRKSAAHRDVKADNIFVSSMVPEWRDGQEFWGVKLGDFGCSRVLATEMPPEHEQLRSPQAKAVDLFL